MKWKKQWKAIAAAAVMLSFSSILPAQNQWSTTTASGNNLAPFFRNNILGTDGTFTPVAKRDIRFFTAGAERMRLIGSGANIGFLGIGLPAPLWRLDVLDNINVNPAGANFFDGYRVSGSRFLNAGGLVANQSTFVGVSGNPVIGGGLANTVVGFDAAGGMMTGTNCTGGAHHSTVMGVEAGYTLGGGFITLMGYRAGYLIEDGDFSTFVGAYAGENSSCSANNAFFGGFAGNSTLNGSQNTYLGMRAGFNATTSARSVAVGFNSAANMTTGSDNVAVGSNSGTNMGTGPFNILLGNNSDVLNPTITNSTAIGFAAQVTGNDKMILGNNKYMVGIGLSGDNIQFGPQNKLEIDAGLNGFNPELPGNTGASGLRFRDLHALCVPQTNPGKGVLAVDLNGDVIYVNLPPSSAGLGNPCSTPGANPLTGSWEVPMNAFNFDYTVPAATQSQVNIGFPACIVNPARLNVNNDAYNVGEVVVTTFSSPVNAVGEAVRVTNTGTGNAIGVSSNVVTSSTTANAISYNANVSTPNSFYNIGYNANVANASFASIGVNSDITSSASGINQGLNTEITSGTNAGAFNTGVSVLVNSQGNINSGGDFSVTGASGINFGVRAQANNSITAADNVGVMGTAVNTGTLPKNVGVAGRAFNFGTITTVSGSGNLMNIGVYGEGDIGGYFTGVLLSTQPPLTFSDAKLKTNVQNVENANSLIAQLRPVTYNMKTSEYAGMRLADEKQYGFIAQELQQVMPEAVQSIMTPEFGDEKGENAKQSEEVLAVNYTALIPVLTQALQEQQRTIAEMQQQIEELRNQLTAPSQPDLLQGAHHQSTVLSDGDAIVLDQNAPNPFAEETRISWYLPENTGAAQLRFFTIDGKHVKTVDIEGNGHGTLTVYAQDLSKGVYFYSLLVNGEVVDTKKMEKN